ncbi:MAG TPA: hypothetical protein VMV49_18225 [Candidatus Deferrimicrobium sp.]|nr:hypothetical protein [Candidatus Deferrimicrobium sp.]
MTVKIKSYDQVSSLKPITLYTRILWKKIPRVHRIWNSLQSFRRSIYYEHRSSYFGYAFPHIPKIIICTHTQVLETFIHELVHVLWKLGRYKGKAYRHPPLFYKRYRKLLSCIEVPQPPH